MAFDLSTAKPIGTEPSPPEAPSGGGGFDLSSARPGPVSPELAARQAGPLGRKAEAAKTEVLGQMEPGVDYLGYPDFKAQAVYSILTTPEEKESYLRSKFGTVTKDAFGRDVIEEEGKRYAFLPRGPEIPRKSAGYGGIAGGVAPTLGMAAGGVLGTGLAGPPGGIAGTGMGAIAGESINQLVKNALGLGMQTPGETAGSLYQAGGAGAVAGALGEGLLLGGRTLLAPYKPGSALGPWKANEPMYRQQMGDVEAARGLGLTPKVGTYAPSAVFAQRVQNAAFRLFGDETPSMNRPLIERGAERLMPGQAAPTAERLSQQISERATGLASGQEQAVGMARSEADRFLADAQNAITGRVGRPTGKLSQNVAQEIETNRGMFGRRASDLYEPIDQSVGKPIVPTFGLKQRMRSILEEAPPTKAGEVSVLAPENLKTFAKGIEDLPDQITFKQMQLARHKFRSKAELDALNSGLSGNQASQLAKAADQAFDDAVRLSPEAKPYTDAIRRADAYYQAGIKRFNNLSVEALVKDASQTGNVQPELVARFIARPDQVSRLAQIRKVVSPETFKEVGAERWKQILEDSTESLTGGISGTKLAKQLADMGKTLDVLYGPEANAMRQYARQLAAHGGRPIDPNVIGSGDIGVALQRAATEQQRLDQLVKSDWMTAVRTDGKQSLYAADYLTDPANRLQLRKAMNEFGPGSAEVSNLKEYLARRIFSKMEVESTKGAERYSKTELMGAPLIQELDRYGKPYLTEVFGKEWVDKTYDFAKAVDTATRKNPTDSGGLLAAVLGLHPFTHKLALARIFGGNYLFTHPTTITYMTRGIEGGPTEFIRGMGEAATRLGTAYEAENLPKKGAEEARGIKYKLQGELNQPR